MCYPKSVNFIEFLMDFCIYDDILDTIHNTDKTLLHFKHLKSGQILRVYIHCKQVDILISKNQALQIVYLKHCVYNNETT